MKTAQKILAIARTEFRFGLRRGTPVVVTAAIGLLLGAGILLPTVWANLEMADPSLAQFSAENLAALAQNGITAEIFRSLMHAEMADLIAIDVLQAWIFLYLALLFLPIATAGALPADRKFGVSELLRSLPIDGNIYLAGKVLGSIGIVLFIGLFPYLLFLAVIEGIMLVVYGFMIPQELLLLFLKLTVLDALPVLTFSAAIGVLAATPFRSRRAAILPGFTAGILNVVLWRVLFWSPAQSFQNFDLAAYRVLQGYQDVWSSTWTQLLGPIPSYSVDTSLLGAEAPVVGIAQVLGISTLMLAILIGGFCLARLWLQRKEYF